MDVRYGSERKRWVLLLTPMWKGFAWKGAVVMAMPKKIVGGIVLLALLLGGAWLFRARGPTAPPATTAGTRAAAPARPPGFVRPVAVPTGAIKGDDSVAGTVEGQVVSAANGEGIAGAELLFSFGDTSLAARAMARDAFASHQPIPAPICWRGYPPTDTSRFLPNGGTVP